MKLVELLTDIADSIRAKDGTVEKINAVDFAQRILDIPSGGESNLVLLQNIDITENVNALSLSMIREWIDNYDFLLLNFDFEFNVEDWLYIDSYYFPKSKAYKNDGLKGCIFWKRNDSYIGMVTNSNNKIPIKSQYTLKPYTSSNYFVADGNIKLYGIKL